MDMTNGCRQASSDLLFADLNHGHCYYFSKYTWARRWRVSTQRKTKGPTQPQARNLLLYSPRRAKAASWVLCAEEPYRMIA
jgi:hypothetical protein